MNTEVIEKIQKLLALATSPNEHEAKLAAEKANELLLKHNLRMQDIKYEDKKYVEEDIHTRGRCPIEAKFVCSIIKRYFYVEPVFQRNRMTSQTLIYFVGEETNVKVAYYVYHFLITKFLELWYEYKSRTMSSAHEKQGYYKGLQDGFNEQLRQKVNSIQDEMSLVLVRDPKLDELTKNLKIRHDSVPITNEKARTQGYEDGQKIKISKGIESNSTQSGKYLK